MQRRDLNAPDAPPPVAAYTQAIEVTGATRTLYISGQVGQRMDGTIPADIVEQSRLAIRHSSWPCSRSSALLAYPCAPKSGFRAKR
jgi:enamine deaminase RidA (YjgF/YER057c/UK114 family)